jgi:hypothetical protein
MVNFVRCPRCKEEPERTRKKQVKKEQDKKELNVSMLINDNIIKYQGEKQDGDPYESDKDGLCKFTEPGFAENLTVRPHQCVEDQPETRDNGYSVIKLFIQENVIEMAENLVIYCIFPVNKEQGPGNTGCQKICSNIFNDL